MTDPIIFHTATLEGAARTSFLIGEVEATHAAALHDPELHDTSSTNDQGALRYERRRLQLQDDGSWQCDKASGPLDALIDAKSRYFHSSPVWSALAARDQATFGAFMPGDILEITEDYRFPFSYLPQRTRMMHRDGWLEGTIAAHYRQPPVMYIVGSQNQRRNMRVKLNNSFLRPGPTEQLAANGIMCLPIKHLHGSAKHQDFFDSRYQDKPWYFGRMKVFRLQP